MSLLFTTHSNPLHLYMGNETDIDKSVQLSLSVGEGTQYINLETGKSIDLKSTKLNLEGNGGVFLLNNTRKATSNRHIKMMNSSKRFTAFPNPFTNEITIEYDLEKEGLVELSIYDSMGSKIQTLVKENKVKGKHNIVWNALCDSGKQLPSGLYLCCIKTNTYSKNILVLLQ